jgi:carbon starvation protein CstA
MLNREHVTDALRFWELARLPYNLILLAIVAGAMWLGEQNWRAWLDLAPAFLVLGVVANLVYCAVYPVDLLLQASDFRPQWRALRWLAWGAGMTLAAAFAAIAMLGVQPLEF